MNKTEHTRLPLLTLTILAVLSIMAWTDTALADAHGLGKVKEIKVESSFVELVCENGKARISKMGSGKIHIRATNETVFSSWKSFALRGEIPSETAPRIKEEGDKIILDAGLIKVVVDKRDATMDILDRDGSLMIEEPVDGGIFFDGESPGCIKVMPPDEHYYGFGEKTGPLDKRGTRMEMWTSDMPYNDEADPLYQAHPYYMALRKGKAYGIFFDNTFKSYFDMGSRQNDRVSFSADGGEVDYWVLAGPAPRDVLSRYAELVGAMPLPPLWGLGKHQCRWSYKTDKRVREIHEGYRENDIPLDVIYLDIHYMVGYRVFTFNNERFPDPKGLITELMEDGVRTVVIVDPGIKIDPHYRIYQEGMEKDYFVRHVDGGYFQGRVWPGDVYWPDFYRPEVRQWWGNLLKFYTDLGVAGFWNDMNEPAGWGKDIRVLDYMVPVGKTDWSKMQHGTPQDIVTHERIHNVYALLQLQGTYEGMLKLRPDNRPFLITRSGFPGIQNYSLIWTGDNFSTWKSLRGSVPMHLNMGLSGLAFAGADIGGFGGAPSREMYARWIELGVFYPFCRTHTSANMPDQEPWSFGPKVTDISRDVIKLRYRLLPYTYSVFEESTRTGWPVMRAMVFEFPADENVANMADQFMWGEWMLVAPVVKRGQTKRTIYLPKGQWYDFFTGESFAGPRTIEVDTPLEKLPIFAKAGAIIPMAPDMRHTGEKPWDPLTVEVFPGPEPSSFVLYEDDGESMAYTRGEWARTKFSCRPVTGGIEVKAEGKKGSYDPQRESIIFKVHGMGSDAKVSMLCKKCKEHPEVNASYDQAKDAWIIKLPTCPHGKTIRIINSD